MTNDDLNPRRDDFCREYVCDPNGTRAAIRAGYARESAHVEASRLLRNAKVQDRIQELRTEIAERHCLRADALMGKLEAVFHRAYNDHQMHAAVRAVELQAKLAGAVLERRVFALPVIEHEASEDARGGPGPLRLVSRGPDQPTGTGPSTAAGSRGTVGP